ncbi:hypothetical protein R6Q59_024443 [Mikania micrantha]
MIGLFTCMTFDAFCAETYAKVHENIGDHHHHHEPPTKRFEYLKRRTTNDPKIITPESQPTDKRFGEKIEPKLTKKASDHKNDVDESIEFYAKTTSEPILSHDHYDAEFVDIVFGVNSLQVTKNTIPVSNNQDFSDLNKKKNANSNGSKIVLENKQSLKKKNRTNFDDAASQETEIRKMLAVIS